MLVELVARPHCIWIWQLNTFKLNYMRFLVPYARKLAYQRSFFPDTMNYLDVSYMAMALVGRL